MNGRAVMNEPVAVPPSRGTLKAFKDAIRPGLKIRVVDHWLERHRGSVRCVTKVQGNGYWFTQEGLAERCWAEHPKASQLAFNGTVAKIVLDAKRFWTLDLSASS